MNPIPNDVADLFHYEPNTGVLTRNVTVNARAAAGQVAGSISLSDGYRYVSIRYRRYLLHRVAWAISHADPGAMHVDHRDGVRTNNRLDNLRLATHADNSRNRKKSSNNTSGENGVSRFGNKWRATITFYDKQIFLGCFDRIEEAAAAHRAAASNLHGEFAAHKREVAR